MKTNQWTLAAALALVLAAAGCSSADGQDTPRTTMLRIDGCGQTQCQQARETCEARSDSACDECSDACYDAIMEGVYLDCDSSCSLSCRDSSCGSCQNDTTPCVRRSYSFELPEYADPEAIEACERAMARQQRCGLDSGEDCVRWASEVGPAGVPMAECLATLPCDEDATPCYPAPGSLGTTVCGVLGGACGFTCDSDMAVLLNLMAGYLAQDLVEQAEACMKEPSCEDKRACFNAWGEAL